MNSRMLLNCPTVHQSVKKGSETMNFIELAENAELEIEEFLELLKLFVETCSSDLKKLQTSIDKGNLQGVVESAHSIRGAAGNLGFDEIYQVAKDVEIKARQNILEGASKAVRFLYEELDKISKKSANSNE